MLGQRDRARDGGTIANRATLVLILLVGSIMLLPLCQATDVDAPGNGQGGMADAFFMADGAQQTSFTINQTLSDQAQQNTIAFDALAFMTGNLGSDSFFPPGKVADFWGFQYLRDNDPSRMGHNTDFLTRAANNMLYILNDSQRAKLIALASEQVDDINQYALDRFVLIDAFDRLLQGDVPENSKGLDLDAVMNYSAELYLLDGEISLERAQVMGSILYSLNDTQIAYLEGLRGKGMLEWPDVGDQLDPRSLSHDEHVAVMTYAGDLFSWYMGSIEADVYFCPERQGTYFGSFYLKDAPAIGNPNYTINETITGNSGAEFLKVLTTSQAKLITDLVGLQRSYLDSIVELRMEVSEQLRLYMEGRTADTALVLEKMEQYGKMDGAIITLYATAFAKVNETLSTEQRAAIADLRSELGVGVANGAFIYSQPVDMPEIPNTDFLFAMATPSRLSQAPVGLSTIPGDAVVMLTWSLPLDSGGSPVISYNVYRSASAAGPFTLIASSSSTNYTDVGLENGQSYWYKVCAITSSGEGQSSSTAVAELNEVVAKGNDNTIPYVIIAVLTLTVLGLMFLLILRRR